MFKVIGVTVIGLLCAVTLKKNKPEIAIAISILTGLLIAWFTFQYIAEYKSYFLSWTGCLTENRVYIGVIFKMIGITYLCDFCSDLCKDAGYHAISRQVTIFGKCVILFTGVPIVTAILEIIEEMI